MSLKIIRNPKVQIFEIILNIDKYFNFGFVAFREIKKKCKANIPFPINPSLSNSI